MRPKAFWIKISNFDKVGMAGFRYADCEISIDPNCVKNYEDFKKSIRTIEYSEYEKLTKACEIMKQALKAIRETNISGANIYAGAESMEFDAFEALEQVEKVLGEK